MKGGIWVSCYSHIITRQWVATKQTILINGFLDGCSEGIGARIVDFELKFQEINTIQDSKITRLESSSAKLS